MVSPDLAHLSRYCSTLTIPTLFTPLQASL
jgi:hypothetical protein